MLDALRRILHPSRVSAAATAALLCLAVVGTPAAAKKNDAKKEAKKAGKKAHKASIGSIDDLRYPSLPEVEIPQPERVELDNGMVVLLLEDHELPLVEATAVIRTGSVWESADKIGLANLFGQVLRTGGTETMTGDDLDDFLENRAAIIETQVGETSGSASMSCLAKDFGEILQVFADVLRHPVFDEDKLAVAKNQAVSGIARQNDNASQILGRELQDLVYGAASPYARVETYETVGNISRRDLVEWHARDYHPERVVLGLVGDFERDAALAEVRRVFGDWQRGGDAERPEIPKIETAPPGVYFIEKDDVTQSFIRLGHLGVKRDHPDYYAIEVMNEVLGGGFAARLFSRVRSQLGLAYSVYGGVYSSWNYPGMAMLHISTKTETTGAAIEALLGEARKMRTEAPTEAEVARAKEAILSSFVFRSDSTDEILNQQLTYELYGYPLDWQERYRAGIEGATVDQVRAAAKHLDPDRFVIAVVGKRDGMDRDLADFGEVHEVDITIPEPPVAEVEITEEGKARGGELLTAMHARFGGAAVDAVTSVETSFQATLTTPQGEMAIQGLTLIDFPSRFRQEMKLPFGTMTQALDGEGGGFLISPQGTQALPPPAVDSLRGSLLRYPLSILKSFGAGNLEAVATGPADVAGQKVENVHLEVGGEPVTLGIAGDGTLVSLTYRGQGMTGAPGEIVQVFSDYRDVDGVQMPHAIQATFEGSPMLGTEVEKIVLNGEIDPAKFEKPE